MWNDIRAKCEGASELFECHKKEFFGEKISADLEGEFEFFCFDFRVKNHVSQQIVGEVGTVIVGSFFDASAKLDNRPLQVFVVAVNVGKEQQRSTIERLLAVNALDHFYINGKS